MDDLEPVETEDVIEKPQPARVVFWQLMAFLMLLLLVWVNELMDLAALWYGTPPRAPNYFSGWIMTAGILLTALIAISQTMLLGEPADE